MSKTTETLTQLVTQFGEDEAKFENGNYSASTRARATLQEIKKLCQERREEIVAQRKAA
jgi:hypothetical protein